MHRNGFYLISPYLKLNDRVKELLEDKDRMKIDVRIVYGKSELQPSEAAWLKKFKLCSYKLLSESSCKMLRQRRCLHYYKPEFI